MSQEELAEAAQTTRRTVGSIERGDSVAQADILKKLLKALGYDEAPPTVNEDVRLILAVLEPLLAAIDAPTRGPLVGSFIEQLVAARRNVVSAKDNSDVIFAESTHHDEQTRREESDQSRH